MSPPQAVAVTVLAKIVEIFTTQSHQDLLFQAQRQGPVWTHCRGVGHSRHGIEASRGGQTPANKKL